tara:strand:+ start:181 stop:423 length:243 start_codon:yes stop_codon:yes gene_type:complete
MKGLEARLARLECTCPTNENRLMALFASHGDAYTIPRVKGGDWMSGLERIRQELDEGDAKQLIGFCDWLIARSTTAPTSQ